jgi:hypothetical protein
MKRFVLYTACLFIFLWSKEFSILTYLEIGKIDLKGHIIDIGNNIIYKIGIIK